MTTSFKDLGLIPELLKSLETKGYETPSPIQEQAIPLLIQGHDLLGIAQTGTGKTAAFSLPLIQGLKKSQKKARPARTRALILTPTRELASQINDNIIAYSKGLGLKTSVIFGGVGHRPQIQKMSRGVDILVATPGRLLDLMDDGHVQFDALEFFILDEADRMLDMGFIRDIKKIIKLLPPKRQTLLFSATMPSDIASLANSLLKKPKRVEVTPQATTVDRIEQVIKMVSRKGKPFLLKELINEGKLKTVLVFSRTKHGANRIVKHLDKANISSAAIHGNKSQGAREKALEGFRSEKIRVLVATDIAARGIDVSGIGHVINYDLPDDPKNYVHRIGRTARAGREGVAISFCSPEERGNLKDIERLIGLKLKKEAVEETIEETTEAPRSFPSRGKRPAGQNRRPGTSGPRKKSSQSRRPRPKKTT